MALTAFLGSSAAVAQSATRHLAIDLNPQEGFNLRRDALIRAALVAKALGPSWTLVLPAFPRLPHWNHDTATGLGWGRFFDLATLGRLVPVVESEQFERLGRPVDLAVLLQKAPLPPAVPLLGSVDCEPGVAEREPHGGLWRIRHATGAPAIRALRVECRRGNASLSELTAFLRRVAAADVYVTRFEMAYWDASYDGADYWAVRRALRFAPHLVAEAERFISARLRAPGRYVAVHLRRGDFAHAGRAIPTVRHAADQIDAFAQGEPVFLATDGTADEVAVLASRLPSLVRYVPSEAFAGRDGEVAIIDQLVAMKASRFIGTDASTFSTVIMEERALSGATDGSTWRVLCASGMTCEQPAPRRPAAPR